MEKKARVSGRLLRYMVGEKNPATLGCPKCFFFPVSGFFPSTVLELLALNNASRYFTVVRYFEGIIGMIWNDYD